jgi:hypothetical protein
MSHTVPQPKRAVNVVEQAFRIQRRRSRIRHLTHKWVCMASGT